MCWHLRVKQEESMSSAGAYVFPADHRQVGARLDQAEPASRTTGTGRKEDVVRWPTAVGSWPGPPIRGSTRKPPLVGPNPGRAPTSKVSSLARLRTHRPGHEATVSLTSRTGPFEVAID